MEAGAPPGRARWWEADDRISVRLAGVFEGGGAKGAAYVGALQATRVQGCWFSAVAGASAGAITAALIACGLIPEEIAAESEEAFKRLRPRGALAGIRRLRTEFGALDNDDVHAWLEEVLARQVTLFGCPPDGAVTFASLHRATEIELNVVCADLSRGRQLVFSPWDTPGVPVADAVLASSSIPFAFAPRYFAVHDGGGEWTHTLADGGVWANFPTFVFADRSFRIASGRNEQVAADYVVGYLLDEADEEDVDVSAGCFVAVGEAPDAFEWRRAEGPPPAKRTRLTGGAAGAVLGLLLLPLRLVIRLGAWLSLGDDRAWRPRWPTPGGTAGVAVRTVNDALSALHSAWLAGIAALAIVGGTAAAIYWLITSFLFLRLDELWLALVFGDIWPVVRETIQVILVIVAIGLLIVLAVLVLVALAANFVLLGPVRDLLFGLTRTYVAGSGAPRWAGHAAEDHVLRLPIPRALTTLSFDASEPSTAAAIARANSDAYNVASTGLQRILAGQKQGATPPQSPPTAAPATPTPQRPRTGSGFALRLSVLAGALAAVMVVISWLAPQADFYVFDVNVRVCREPLMTPDAPCDEPTPDRLAATVLFGPPSAGQMTQATLIVNGRLVERSAAVVNTRDGRIVSVPIAPRELCPRRSCTIVVRALVDGKRVYGQRIHLDTDLDVDRD